MRTFIFNELTDDIIYIRLVQALNWQGNQGGDYNRIRKLLKLIDLFASIGTEYKTEAVVNNRPTLMDAIRLNEGQNRIQLEEQFFSLLSECVDKFNSAGACHAKDALMIRDYLDTIIMETDNASK